MKARIISVLLAFVMCYSLIPYKATQVAAAGVYIGNRDWKWPVPSANSITSCYLNPSFHKGEHYALDIPAGSNSKIYASYSGEVIYTYTGCTENGPKSEENDYACPCGSCSGLGNCVYIRHTYLGRSFVSRYAHMTSVTVLRGQTVTKDTVIGTVGCTGSSTGDHLDFRIYAGESTS